MIATSLKSAAEVIKTPTNFFPENPIATGFIGYFNEFGEKVIQGLKRISKPGLRLYANAEQMPKVLNGLGIAIVSTNKGIMTDREARKNNVGGEVLAYVW